MPLALQVNATLEAMALVREAWKDLNGEAVPLPELRVHAVEGATGALFIEQAADPASGRAETSPVAIAHRILELVKQDKHAASMCAHALLAEAKSLRLQLTWHRAAACT